MKGETRKIFLLAILLGMFILNACIASQEVVSATPTSTIEITTTQMPALSVPEGMTVQPSLAPTRTFAPTYNSAHTRTPTPDYFLDDLTPETPSPTSTSANGSLCNNSAYIADVNYPDGTVVEPWQEFKKTWRVQNIGTCGWTADYSLNFIYGNEMNGARSVPIESYVLPGQQIDVSVRLTAPNCEGNKHIGVWQLADDSGRGFGVRLYVSVNVRLKATLMPGEVCTPMPTPTLYKPTP